MKQRKRLDRFILLVCATLVAAIGVSLFLTNKSVPKNTEAVDTTNWITYVDDKSDISLKYPQNYAFKNMLPVLSKADRNKYLTVVSFSDVFKDHPETLATKFMESPWGYPTLTIARTNEKSLDKIINDWEKSYDAKNLNILSTNKITFSDVEEEIVTADGVTRASTSKTIFFLKNGYLYVLTYDSSDGNLQIFDAIASNISFTK